MKLLMRTLIILAVALSVAGATYAMAGQGANASAGGRFPARAEVGRPGGEFRDGDFGGEPRGSRGGGLFGAVEVLRDLVIIGVIVAVVAPVKRLLNRRKPAANRRRAALGDHGPEPT
jgi:hypothetical protein